MLRNTFVHIPGVGQKIERKLWSKGILSWEDAIAAESRGELRRPYFLKSRLLESRDHLEDGNAVYFAKALQAGQHWRMFPHFRDDTAYLDIETFRLGDPSGCITTISLFDGKSVTCYVNGRNLHQFAYDVQRFKVIVTYNGRQFDVPVLERFFNIKLPQAHIDLMYVLRSLGYRGGLKGCEKKMGLDRADLEGVDGYFAVLLWDEFRTNRNEKVLETLMAYNILDAVNLEPLMVKAYNLKLEDTPFSETHCLPLPEPVKNPVQADIPTIRRIREKIIRWA
jgi:uncharacterized protein